MVVDILSGSILELLEEMKGEAMYEDYDEYDHCYECGGYGDDYFINDEGELESSCPTCPFNPHRYDEDWDDD